MPSVGKPHIFRHLRPLAKRADEKSRLGATRALGVAALLAAAACAPPPTDPPPPPVGGPLDRAEYAHRLAAAAGGPVSVDRIVEVAGSAAARVEARMDRLAADLGEPAGWRPLFERLRRQAPTDEAAVLQSYRDELARAAEFVRARSLVSLPPTPPEVLTLDNPSLRAHFPLALYHDGRFAVTTRSAEDDDPAYLANHCRVCIPPLAVHEGYPGHHVAFARMADASGKGPSVAELARHKPFVEGWALYAELLMLENGYYADLERRIAAWRMVLLRLIRAEVDARLHGGDLDPEAAAEGYEARVLMTPAAADAEVRTHLAKPTVKASYFLGMLQILELRRAFRAAQPETTPGEFHDRLLGPPATLPAIARQRFGLELGPPGEGELPWPWSPAGAATAASR